METTSTQDAETSIKNLLKYIGENPQRQELIETPKRFMKALKNMFEGYLLKPNEILSKTFENTNNYNEIILLKNISFQSYCEHDIMPFFGKAHVAYIPYKQIIGISKLAEIVNVFAKRLQIQERLTIEIASAIETFLKPKGTGIIINSVHKCMMNSNKQNDKSILTTSCMRGIFKNNTIKFNELLSLIKK